MLHDILYTSRFNTRKTNTLHKRGFSSHLACETKLQSNTPVSKFASELKTKNNKGLCKYKIKNSRSMNRKVVIILLIPTF